MAGPTQPQVFDDAWDDQRIDEFYQDQKARGTRRDFDLIEAGYRGMRADDLLALHSSSEVSGPSSNGYQ